VPLSSSYPNYKASRNQLTLLYRPLNVSGKRGNTQVPLVIVEHVKSNADAAGLGEKLHFNHLKIAMASAAVFSASMRLSHPIVGILVYRWFVSTYAMVGHLSVEVGWRHNHARASLTVVSEQW
jgi:hypothetical protein